MFLPVPSHQFPTCRIDLACCALPTKTFNSRATSWSSSPHCQPWRKNVSHANREVSLCSLASDAKQQDQDAELLGADLPVQLNSKWPTRNRVVRKECRAETWASKRTAIHAACEIRSTSAFSLVSPCGHKTQGLAIFLGASRLALQAYENKTYGKMHASR